MDEDQRRLDILLSGLDHAHRTFEHSDAVFWEITAIMWGSSTLILGFVLEADPVKVRPLIVAAAVVGALLSLVVLVTFYSIKVGQDLAVKTYLNLEARLEQMARIALPGDPPIQPLHRMIRESYPRRFIRKLIWTVTIVFLVVWATVGYRTAGVYGASLVILSELSFSLLAITFWKRGKSESVKTADD